MILRMLSLAITLMIVPAALRADAELRRAEGNDDRIGARVRVRELLSGKIDQQIWRFLESRLQEHPEWGDDLYGVLLDKVASSISWLESTPLQLELERADEAIASRQFLDAVRRYRAVLSSPGVSELPRETSHFVRLSLSRALYGAKKFDEALQESRKIPPRFSRYRHVLFLRMWSAFRAGRVEMALGEIAAQRSAYFGPYMEPESYLLLAYLLRRLCRDAEAVEVIAQVESFLNELKSGKIDWKTWASFEVGTQTYAKILEQPEPSGLAPQKMQARERERKGLIKLLETGFAKKKKQWLEELPRVVAYSRLAITPGMTSELKEIEKITSREKLLARGYEIWPALENEHWLDELGSQRYLGDSECTRK